MERKDYLNEELSKEEKLYLKRIVMTAKNKYIKKNEKYINKSISLDDAILFREETILDVVLQRCQNELASAVEFEKSFSDTNLYNIVKALTFREKEVLFYLYKEEKNINEISKIMNLDRKTIRTIRNKAQAKIVEKLVKGEY